MMAKIDDNIIQLLALHKTILQDRFDVESLFVFGSFSRGQETPSSDIDILVRYRKTPGLFGFIDLKQYLEQVLGRPVDLVTEKALKKQIKDAVLKEAVCVT